MWLCALCLLGVSVLRPLSVFLLCLLSLSQLESCQSLKSSVNRHGLSLAAQDVRLPGEKPKTHKLSEARTKKKGDLWILVQATR